MAISTNYSTQHLSLSTSDGLKLPGLLFSPTASPDLKTMFIFLHGCGSSSVFYKAEKMHIFAETLSQMGAHFLAFNNRGSHYIKKFSQTVSGESHDIKIGTALEEIKDCVYDIDAAVTFAQDQGMENMYLIGESTGANKCMVYDHLQPDNPLAGYACVGGGDDMGLWAQQFGLETWPAILDECARKLAGGEGDHLHSSDLSKGIMSYKALFDVLNPDGEYNCFPFTEHHLQENWSTQPLFRFWSAVTRPTLMLYGSEDIFTTIPPEEAIDVLAQFAHRDAQATYRVIAGADHSFHGAEQQEIDAIVSWWKSLAL